MMRSRARILRRPTPVACGLNSSERGRCGTMCAPSRRSQRRYSSRSLFTCRAADQLSILNADSGDSMSLQGRSPLLVRDADPAEIDQLTRIWYEGWHEARARIVPTDLTRLRTWESFRLRLRQILPGVRVVDSGHQAVEFASLAAM